MLQDDDSISHDPLSARADEEAILLTFHKKYVAQQKTENVLFDAKDRQVMDSNADLDKLKECPRFTRLQRLSNINRNKKDTQTPSKKQSEAL